MKSPAIRLALSPLLLGSRTVLSGVALAMLLSGGVAQAQLTNDPADTMVYTAPSRFVRTPQQIEADRKMQEVSAQQEPGEKDKADKTDVSKPVQPLPPELQPELDLQKPAGEAANVAPAAAGEPIKARAVMVDINSNTLNYDKDHDVYIATGSVHMVISEQNSELYADKMTYDQNQDLVIAEGSVVIVKNGQRTEGTYAKIDLTRESALINDPVTTVNAVRVKAKQSFVNANYIELENGRLIISGKMFQKFAQNGGLQNVSQGAGKGAAQAKLRREYSKQVYENRREMVSQLSFDQQQLYQGMDQTTLADSFDDTGKAVSKFSIKAKEIEVKRGADGYDDVMMKHPSLYYGKFKLFNLPNTDFSYDEEVKQIQYLGPDIGSNRALGGTYGGPGWDFHMGRGSLRISPIVSYGNPGFFSKNGKDAKDIGPGFGIGGVMHYRDPNTALDLGYNSRVGAPVFFGDRRIFGETTHVMAAANDFYYNGLLGQQERPNYIAQITDYRVLKNFGKFQLTSFESIGYARDNFYPNFRDSYFVKAKEGASPQSLGRAQLQFQLANTAPLLRIGKYATIGARAQWISSAYSSGDFVGLARIGPTLNLNLIGGRLMSSLGYTITKSFGESPFVFDSYYGGSQNVNVSNLFRVNKYLSLGMQSSFSLKRDNSQGALAVGNSLYMMVGPQDVKATIGYDVINQRSYFGFNYFPGKSNTVVNYDRMKIFQPPQLNETMAQPAAEAVKSGKS